MKTLVSKLNATFSLIKTLKKKPFIGEKSALYVFPMEYGYDEFGRMVTLKTFRSGENWSQPTWPLATQSEAEQAADETTWTYNEATGLLTKKTYADDKGPSYTYNAAGQLATRIWDRTTSTGEACLAQYTYDNNTGALASITYSDDTPAVGFTYDRLGRQTTVTDAQGTRTFAYNDKLQLESETVDGKVIARKYDTLGRSAGFSMGTYDIGYSYDAYGRFEKVVKGTDEYVYGYTVNSNLIGSVTMPNGLVTTKTYETNRNLVDAVENKFGTSSISKYDFTNDAIGRRTDVTKTGTAFTVADTVTYNYNDRSEVTGATATTDTNYNFGYEFDNLGNRISSSTSESGTAETMSYTANSLNQYTGINSSNPSNPVNTSNPSYDTDGNMTGTWLKDAAGTSADSDLYYNAENRLVKVIGSGQKLEFVYDYMGRRVNKKVFSGTESAWTLETQTKFLYDGWNLLEEITTNSQSQITTTKSYTWGLDLSQTLQGAGGVGGLLAMENSNDESQIATYYYTYDANGNVSELIDTAGVVQAHYEYSPFGKLTYEMPNSVENSFKFSTKYLDEEVQLYYYGLRYYNPESGRWINRDPIREKGGYNLYGFISNGSTFKIDLLGLSSLTLSEDAELWDWDVWGDDLLAEFSWETKWKCGEGGLSLDGAERFDVSKKDDEIHVSVEGSKTDKIDKWTYKVTHKGEGSWEEWSVAGAIGGGLVGGVAGAGTGAQIGGAGGTVVAPGPGTATGAVVGGVLGGAGGAIGGALTFSDEKTANYTSVWQITCRCINSIEVTTGVKSKTYVIGKKRVSGPIKNNDGDLYWK